MSDVYEKNKNEIIKDITAYKLIYKYRNFLYSLNKNVRQECFMLTRKFLENEQHNDLTTQTENERLIALLNHWQWNSFELNSSSWWIVVSNFIHSLSLLTIIRLWVDDINIFDPESFETSTDGVR